MIPAAFDYVRVDSTEAALAALAEHGDDAKLLAGGQSLLPLMKLRLATPAVLVDVGRLDELRYVRDEGEVVAIGALTRHAQFESDPVVAEHVPLLAATAHHVGDPQVRHRGTLGGSLVHGDPASDLPAAALALGVTLVVQGPSGRREVAVDDFFRGFLETAVGPDELLTEIRVPKRPGARWSFQKYTRRAIDWAVVGAAVLLADDHHGVGLVHMASRPVRAPGVEAALAGGATPDEAAASAADGLEPPADGNASSEFRCHLARVLVRRGIDEARRR